MNLSNRSFVSPRTGLAIMAGVLLAACGGGGGGGGTGGSPAPTSFGNSLPPATGPGDTENFFPNSTGNSWNYSATGTVSVGGVALNSLRFIDSMAVTGTRSINGQIASVFLHTNTLASGESVENYYLKNAGGVAFLGTNDLTDTITAGFVPYIVGLFPVTPSVVAQFDKSGVNYGADLDGDGVNETLNAATTNTVHGFEPLTIAIGSFPRTVRASEAITGSVVLSATNTNIPFNTIQHRWSAPGIGIIKTTTEATVQTSVLSEVAEARGYVVDGISHGFGMPYTVASNVAAADSDIYNPGLPAVATDGQNFLAASGSPSGVRAVLFNAQGAPVANLTLAPGAKPSAAFDGSDYWLVFTNPSGGAPGCMAQRVSPVGALLDPTPIVLAADTPANTALGFAFGTTNGLIVYTKYNTGTFANDLFGVIVNRNGTVQAPGAFPIAVDANQHTSPVLAFDGTNFFVAWLQHPFGSALGYDIYGIRLSPTGAAIDPAPIPIVTGHQTFSLSIAVDGTNYLLVWLDRRNNTNDIYAARISRAAALLDGTAPAAGFPVSSGGTLLRYSPYVGFLGSEYLAVWGHLGYASNGSPGIQAARVSTGGSVPAGTNATIQVSGPPSASSSSQLVFSVIAAGPQRGTVVWLDNVETSGTAKSLQGATVHPF